MNQQPRSKVPTFVLLIQHAVDELFVTELDGYKGFYYPESDNQKIFTIEHGGVPKGRYTANVMFDLVNWHLQRRSGEPTADGVEPTIHVVMTQLKNGEAHVQDFYYFPATDLKIDLTGTKVRVRQNVRYIAREIFNFLTSGEWPQQ